LQGFLIKKITDEIKLKAAVTAAALSLCALHFSPALSSVSLLIFFAGLLALSEKVGFSTHKQLIYFSLLWCLSQLLIQFYFGFDAESNRKLLLRLPLFLIPLLWCFNPRVSRNFLFTLILLAGLIHTWIGGASVLNYLVHYRFLNQMVLESKPLPLFSSVYHIEFSLIMAIVSLLQLSFLRFSELIWQRRLMTVSLLVNLVSLHILSARTGILAFWLGAPFLVGVIHLPDWFKGPRKWMLLIIPLLLVFAIPSLRNRIINTIDDITAIKQDSNLSDKSFGRRWEAWKVASDVILQKPLIGSGFSGVESAMQLGFEKKQSYLPVTDRIQPHNQFLELALQTGIITTLLFVILLIFMFMHFRRTANYSGLAVLTALAASMFFESYLERQSGVAVFVVSLFFVLFAEKKE
jgi:O-antigen ligase